MMKFKYLFLFIFNTNVNCIYFYDITIVVAPSLMKQFNTKFEAKDYFSQVIYDVNYITLPLDIQFNINNILMFESYCDYLNLHQNSTLMIEEFEKFISKLSFFIKSDHYTLFTADKLSSLGIATIGGMCRINGVSVISVQHERKHVSKIFAHELGHSVDIGHDEFYRENGCDARDGICVMWPIYFPEYEPEKFSNRSINYLNSFKKYPHVINFIKKKHHSI